MREFGEPKSSEENIELDFTLLKGKINRVPVRLIQEWPIESLHEHVSDTLEGELTRLLDSRLRYGAIRINLRIENDLPLITFLVHRNVATMHIALETEAPKLVQCINTNFAEKLTTVCKNMNLYAYANLLPSDHRANLLPSNHRSSQIVSAILTPLNFTLGKWLQDLFLNAIEQMRAREC